MHHKQIYCAGATAAIQYAEQQLHAMGFPITRDHSWDTGHLLLDIPSFKDSATLRTGGKIDTLLSSFPKDVIIWGGNLSCPATDGYRTVDFLQDELYLVKNAAITADCALQVAEPLLTATWPDSPTLVIGWGRIGKHLGQMLKALGCNVTIASRDPDCRASLRRMGYQAVDPQQIHSEAQNYRIVFNTAPAAVIGEEDCKKWSNCVKIDLASQKGIAGDNVVWAKGLPGVYAPESSGKLIAETFARLWKEMEF